MAKHCDVFYEPHNSISTANVRKRPPKKQDILDSARKSETDYVTQILSTNSYQIKNCFFCQILRSDNHVLNSCLPRQTEINCNLRHRPHNRTLAPPLHTQKQCTARGSSWDRLSLSLTTEGSWMQLGGWSPRLLLPSDASTPTNSVKQQFLIPSSST